MLVSLIVPIFNVEQYLRTCIDSLLNQVSPSIPSMDDTPQAWCEIILVDDGSPDSCPQICDEYAQTYAQQASPNGIIVRVIHRPNGGLSAARNTGLLAAQGKYVQFVDSDDFIEPNSLAGLVEQMEREQLDILRFDYQNVRLSAHNASGSAAQPTSHYEIFEPNKTPRPIDHCTAIVDGVTYLNERMSYACYVPQFIIRKSLLLGDKPILFTEGIHYEDVDWTPRVLLGVQRVNATTAMVYNYLHREGSITAAVNLSKKRKNVDDRLLVIERLTTLFRQQPSCSWLQRMRSLMAVAVLNNVSLDFVHDCTSYIRHLRRIGGLPLTIANQGTTFVKRARLIQLCPILYCYSNYCLNRLFRRK